MAQSAALSPLLFPSPPYPTHPDFLLCDRAYGTAIQPIDCLIAINLGFYYGNVPIQYLEGVPDYSHYLPFFSTHGSCTVTVELAGHSSSPRGLIVRPSAIKTLSAQIATQCSALRGGIGGFGTIGLQSVMDYLGTGSDFLARVRDPWPANSAFMTVTVSGNTGPNKHPGSTDPALPIYLALTRGLDTTVAKALQDKAAGMQRGGYTVWWDFTVSSSESGSTAAAVEYQCDSGLGSPSVVDCTQVEWSQLGPTGSASSDTVTVSPGAPTFLHQNTCYLAISATTSAVLTWAQIRTAVEALMNLCIQAPLTKPQGGRAYHTTLAQTSVGRRTRKKRDDGLTGLNALPPAVTVAIFEQRESWVSVAAELVSCTWKAVLNKLPVSRCST